MNYTKGKWSISNDYPKAGDRVIIATLPNGGVKSIAKLTLQHLPEDTEANAHLIAVAPEMYEAVIEAQKVILLALDKDIFYPNLARKVKQALAKAEGK